MAAARQAAPAEARVNFGALSFYQGGLDLAEGDYIMTFTVKMWQPTNKAGQLVGSPGLTVMATAYPLADPSEENAKEQPYGMGSKAHLSFQPTKDGKGLVAVPGGSAHQNDQTRWGFLLKSLYDCGMPEGVFTDTMEALDGIHVHITPTPEPASWKEFRAANATGEAGGGEQRTRYIPIVTEIKDDGKPWEGSGGFPTEKKAAKSGPKAVTKPAASKPAPAPAPEPEADGDVTATASSAIADVLSANPQGLKRMQLRTKVFSAVQKAADMATAQAVAAQVLDNADVLGSILADFGYQVVGEAAQATVSPL